jgi:multimeric flavodoxin WrbA
MKNILILNGSPHGNMGNCQKLISRISKILQTKSTVAIVHLAKSKYSKDFQKKIQKADAIVFVTGTYWDSWGSPLQELLEKMTELEGSDILLGKPCAVFVLEHSVGGKGVLSRLQGVLSTMGFLIPPMSGMVYSWTSHIVMKNSKGREADDFWSLEDVERILQNLFLSLEIQIPWLVWPVDSKNFRKTWLK